ncbi:MAG: sigma-70 family RNA polymerase sigma factor, partial [Acidimicrobiia bacterium]|nr:sigma-70 family RNA polymerase sigma factor [Acidimicrobiia bacterium]
KRDTGQQISGRVTRRRSRWDHTGVQIDGFADFYHRERTLGRRQRREALAGRLHPLPATTPGVDEHDRLSPEMAEALAALSPQQRAVVHLAYWEDLTPPDIATRLAISEGSVRRHLARARRKLRGALRTTVAGSDHDAQSIPGGAR